jgi:hypothetical protein
MDIFSTYKNKIFIAKRAGRDRGGITYFRGKTLEFDTKSEFRIVESAPLHGAYSKVVSSSDWTGLVTGLMTGDWTGSDETGLLDYWPVRRLTRLADWTDDW